MIRALEIVGLLMRGVLVFVALVVGTLVTLAVLTAGQTWK